MAVSHKFPKIAVVFLLALIGMAPSRAQAQSFSTTTDSITLSSTGTQQRTISGTADSTSPLTFNVTIAYQGGDPAWMSFNGSATCTASHSGIYITPVPVYFGLGCFAGQLTANVNHTATVTLTATAPAAAANSTETITVNYYAGTSGNQTLTPSTSAVNISAAPGATGTGSFTLSTTSSSSVSYTISQNPSVSWLSFTQNPSGTVTSGNPLTVGLQANANGLAASSTPYTTNLSIAYNNTTTTVQVNFTVGSGTGNGTLTFGQSNFNFSYSSGSAFPNQQSTSITNSSASTYTFSVNASSNNWLAVNGQILSNGVNSAPILIGTPITLQLDSNVTQLGTGTNSAVVTITDSNNNTGTLTVGLSVNGGAGGNLTVSPNPITLSAPVGTTLAQVNVTVTSSITGTLSASVSGSGLSIPTGGGISQSVTAGVPVTVIVQGNPSGLGAATYTGSLQLQISGSAAPQSYSVNFTVGATTGAPTTVAPTSLNFYYETGQSATAGQLQHYITIGGSGSFTVSSPTENNDTSVAWLTAASQISGTTPALVSVGVNPTVGGGLAPGTYTGSYTVTLTGNGGSSQQTVNVTLTVTSGTPLLVPNPGVVNVSCNSCSTLPTTFVQIVATDGSAQPITVTASSTGNWLSAAVSSTGSTTPTSIQVSFNSPGSLANGLYNGTITVTSGALTTNIPVALLVSGSSTTSGGNLTLGASSLTFNAQVNGSQPASQTLSVSAATSTSFTASVSTTNGGSWLSISPSGNLTTNQTLTVTANQSGLATGTYSGTISLASGGLTQTVGVTLAVSTTGGGSFTVSPNPITLSAPVGTTSTQVNVSVTSTVSGTLTTSITGVGLSIVSASQSVTAGFPVSIVVQGNPSSLPAGIYSGGLQLSVNGTFAAQASPVVFTVGSPSGNGTMSSLSPNSATAGGPAFTVTVSGSGFQVGSIVDWNGTPLTTTYVNTSQLTATVPASVLVYPGTAAVTVFNIVGTASNYLLFTINPPVPSISSLNPSSANAGGTAFNMTVNGLGFLSGSTVYWNGAALSTAYVSASQLIAAVPASLLVTQGNASVTVVNPSGTTSNASTFAVGSSTLNISGLSPSSATAGGPAFTLTVNGAGFLAGSTVLWNGTALSTSYVNSAQQTASVPANLIVSQGTANVTVVNPGGTTSNTATFTISAPVAGISALSPNSATAGAPSFTLTVNGAGFLSGSTVLWNNSALSTSYVSGTQLTASVPASLIVSQGTANVTVANPGSTASNAVTFTITAAVPTISALTPNSTTAGGSAFTLTVSGSGFLTNATVLWNGSALSTSYVNGTQLTASVPANLLTNPGTANVTVMNASGATSTAAAFAINAPAPSITSFSPNSTTAGGSAFSLTVTGNGFLLGATVLWNNSALTTAYLSATQLAATVPATLIAAQGTASVTVVNPGGTVSSGATFTIAPTSTLAIVTSSPLPSGTVGLPYSQALTATGGSTPYKNWTVVTGSVPPGMSLSSISGLLTGLLGGIPSSPGTFSFTVQVTDNSGATVTKPFNITINPGAVSIATNGIVNAASYAGGSVSPGELVTIFGSGMGPSTLAGLQLDSRGYVANLLAGTQVLFDGIAAPVIYTESGQVSVVVPYEVNINGSTQVQVVYQGQRSNAVTIPVTAVTPGIFSIDASGHGPGAIVNQDGTVNTASNPAPVGSYVFVYATGAGQTNPGGVDGQPGPSPAPMPTTQPVTATVGGMSAQVQYAGGVPGLVAGVLQVNVLIPAGVTTGSSVPISFSIGGQTTQSTVTVAVK